MNYISEIFSDGGTDVGEIISLHNHNYIKILESDWSSAGLISAVIVQLHT